MVTALTSKLLYLLILSITGQNEEISKRICRKIMSKHESEVATLFSTYRFDDQSSEEPVVSIIVLEKIYGWVQEEAGIRSTIFENLVQKLKDITSLI